MGHTRKYNHSNFYEQNYLPKVLKWDDTADIKKKIIQMHKWCNLYVVCLHNISTTMQWTTGKYQHS